MTDALEMFRAMRPQGPPTPTSEMRAPASNPSRDLHGLAMVPGSPGYNERIPKPPCHRCGEDHFAGRTYDHEWMPEPVHDEPVAASPSFRQPEMIIEQAKQQIRVAIYVGRGDDAYVLAVESAPDWDSSDSFRVNGPQLLMMVKMVRSLGVKVADKTGGDLVMLEEEMQRAGQYAQNNGGSAQGVRGDSPRRPGPQPDWTQTGQPGGALPPPGSSD